MQKPPFVEGKFRDWKAQKRSELDAVIRAYEVFRCGCAYAPGYKDHHESLKRELESWREKINVKNWGR